MKSRVSHVAAVLLSVATAQAQQYWDTDSANGLQHGDGVWSASDAKWNANSSGNGALSVWGGGFAYFNGSNGTSAVTINSAIGNSRAWAYGSGYTLIVTNGGTLNNSGSFIVGYGIGSSNNTLQVIGGSGVTSQVLTAFGNYAGYDGTNSGNRLIVDGAGYLGSAILSNNGTAGNGLMYMGRITLAKSNNLQAINGGRVYVSSSFGVGNEESGLPGHNGANDNYAVITNGSLLQTAAASIGGTYNTNNWVLVQGGSLGPSRWVGGASADLRIGGNSSGGYTNSGNRLIVDGAGALGGAMVTNFSNLYVGRYNGTQSNSLQIVNGGRVHLGASLYVTDDPGTGAGNGASGNFVMVTNGSALTLGGDKLYIGRIYTTNNWMLVQGGALGASTLTAPAGGANIWIGYGVTNASNRLIVDGTGVAGGAIVTNVGADGNSINVGYGVGAVSDSLQVINGGRVFLRSAANPILRIGVGFSGQDNSLVVTNGGQVLDAYSIYVGAGLTTNSQLLVRGGSGATSFVGFAAGSLYIGAIAGGTNLGNSVIVDGLGAPGSAVVSNTTLNASTYVGQFAGNTSNSLQVVNGGSLSTAYLLIGSESRGAIGNYVTVTNGGYLYVHLANTPVRIGGEGGTNNWMLVQGGTGATSTWFLNAAPIRIGDNGTNLNNTLTVDGAGTQGGALITNVTSVTVGQAGSANSNALRVLNGGRLIGKSSDDAYALTVGAASEARNNSILIDNGYVGGFRPFQVNGSFGSVIVTNGGQLNVGVGVGTPYLHNLGGGTNTVAVYSGSTMTCGNQDFALGTNSAGNKLLVSGGIVSGIGGLHIGTNGAAASFNQLIVTNGGTLSTRSGAIGASTAGQVSNQVVVTGNGSTWDLGGYNLTVGLNTSTGNTLTLDGGGVVTNIGTLLVRSNNAVNLWNGLLSLNSAAVTNDSLFTVGDGVRSAVLQATGGRCDFDKGLLIRSSATLRGSGLVAGGATGVTLTNGAVMTPGVGGPGSGLTISNLTWYGEGVYLCEITDARGAPGVGYDSLTVAGALTTVPGATQMVIRMDAMGTGANFATNRDYNLTIMTYGSAPGLDASKFRLDTSSFPAGGVWSVTNKSGTTLNLIFSGAGPLPFAPTFTWDYTKSGAWSVGGNWTNGGAPTAGGSGSYILEFGGTGGSAYTATNDCGAGFLLNKLLLTSDSSVTNVIGGQSLLFTNAGAGIVQHSDGWFTITNRIGWTDPFSISDSGVGGVILSNVLAGTGTIAIAGSGPVIFSSPNTFSGPVTVNCGGGQGLLRVLDAAGLNTNNVTVSNGVLNIVPSFDIGNSTHKGRSVLVTGSGSLLTNGATITIGNDASSVSNTLTVADQAQLVCTVLSVAGAYNSVVVTNRARVRETTGSGSTLGGHDNTILVTGTGTVMNAGYTINLYSSNNLVRVASGAVLTNAPLAFAAGSGGNSVVVTNGGRLYTINNVTSVSMKGTNHNLIVTGPGSLYVGGGGAASAIIGETGSSNCVLRVEDGAVLTNEQVCIGQPSGGPAVMNRAIVDNAGLYFTSLYVGNGGLAFGNEMVVTNGGQVFGANPAYIGQSGATNNTLTVCFGSAFRCPAAQTMYVGGNQPNATGNRLMVDGGTVTGVSDLQVAGGNAGVRNSVVVKNSGMLTLNGASGARIGVGNNSISNLIEVSSGGVLNANGYPIAIGAGAAGVSNRLVVGAGGIVTNVGTLAVGNPGGANSLSIEGGALSVASLLATNAGNTVAFPAGALNLGGATVSNGLPFTVGDGIQTATLTAQAGGTNTFSFGLIVTNGATLTGAGAIRASNDVYGTLSPGAGVGAMANIGPLTLKPGATTILQIANTNGVAGVGWDLLSVQGDLALNGTLEARLAFAGEPARSQSFLVMTNTAMLTDVGLLSGVRAVVIGTNAMRQIGSFGITVLGAGGGGGGSVLLGDFRPNQTGTSFYFR